VGRLKRSTHHGELRGGYTTGAAAAAAARAAVRRLLGAQPFSDIEITLPNGQQATFALARLEFAAVCQQASPLGEAVIAGVIKDAGDDPDCTHGLEIQCQARWHSEPGLHLKGGQGVATVMLPGLELSVGEAAINPVPRANILAMVSLEVERSQTPLRAAGIELTISVPHGEVVAKETSNERLGLIGGISILGTRGTVKAYSTSAFAASVRQAIQIAAANGLQQVVLTTGSRSEQAAMPLFSQLPELAFIQAGDFIGIGLRAAKRYGLKQVSLVVMIGKMAKLVSGRMMTHVSGHAIDFAQLAIWAEQENLAPSLCQAIATARTGRHVLDLLREQRAEHYLARLCTEAQVQASRYVAGALEVDVQLIDFDGRVLARSAAFVVSQSSINPTQLQVPSEPPIGE
jgi:cobalt-precorrin-5B (C1)-methyltransferase